MSEKCKAEKNKKDKPRCGCKSKKAPVSPTDPNGSYTGRCRFVKHIGQRTPREKANEEVS